MKKKKVVSYEYEKNENRKEPFRLVHFCLKRPLRCFDEVEKQF